MKSKYSFLFCVLFSVLASNSIAEDASVPEDMQSGFLSDYSLLQPVSSDDSNISSYRYVNPNFKRSDYHSVIVNPIKIYQPTTDQNESSLAQIQNTLNQNLSDAIKNKFNLTDKSGDGVAVVSIAITGAKISKDGFRIRNLIPVSAVVKLVTKATDTDKKQAVLLIEAKIVDSKNQELIGQSVTSIRSDKFRDGSITLSKFESDTEVWIRQAVLNASETEK